MMRNYHTSHPVNAEYLGCIHTESEALPCAGKVDLEEENVDVGVVRGLDQQVGDSSHPAFGKEALYALGVVQWLGVGRHRGGDGDDDPGPLQQTHSLGNLVTNWHLLVSPVKRFFNVVSDFLLSELSLPRNNDQFPDGEAVYRIIEKQKENSRQKHIYSVGSWHCLVTNLSLLRRSWMDSYLLFT